MSHDQIVRLDRSVHVQSLMNWEKPYSLGPGRLAPSITIHLGGGTGKGRQQCLLQLE